MIQVAIISYYVFHSMKSDLPLNVTVTLSKLTSFVKKATCKIKALHRCAHIAAILFYVADYAKKTGPTVNILSTSLHCS